LGTRRGDRRETVGFAAARQRWPVVAAVVVLAVVLAGQARAVTNVLFSITQTTNLVATNINSDTIETEGYLFTLSRDKLFTGGVGLTNPIGRSLRVNWPNGLEAQAITAGPSPGGARIMLTRQDGQPFDIPAFTFRLLANTAGAGAMLEIMPLVNGEDAVPDPFTYQATGFYGQTFTNFSPQLHGYDTYKITLYVDFALIRLTMVDPSLPPPVLEIATLNETTIQLLWPTNHTGFSLEATTSVLATAWTPVTNSVAASGDLFTVELETDQSQRFFRLRK
jgi:hypothetical protein